MQPEDHKITFYHEFQGRGGWNIICKVEHEGKSKSFKIYSMAENFINMISDMVASKESFESVQQAYHARFYDDFEDDILKFIEK
jgi:hypothetical protein